LSGGAKGGGKRGGRSPKRGAKLAGRGLATRVRTAKGRKLSSTRWLERQLNDPYVAEARRLGYRSRAAFKLIELDDKHHFLKPGGRVVDLGAAPGGWTQVAVARVKADAGPAEKRGEVVGIDLQEVEPVPGATLIQGDFLDADAPERIKAAMGGAADAVLSDMAAPATGHAATDHLKIMALCEAAYEFALEVLAPGGAFVAKVLTGGTETEMLARMKRDFKTVKHAKPPASRADSKELYLVALGFRG
jgi:23S rRNA (uridine2552-2'-O)-methyltransferase